MIRTITYAVLGFAAAGILATPAQASPAFCAPHDAGSVYITACSHGPGGGSPAGRNAAQYEMKRLGITQADLDKVREANSHH